MPHSGWFFFFFWLHSLIFKFHDTIFKGLNNILLCRCTILYLLSWGTYGVHPQFLAIINRKGMNVIEQVSLWHGGVSFGLMPRRGIAGSSGRSIPNFQKNHHIDFQCDCTSLHWAIICVTDLSYSDRWKIESHNHFNLICIFWLMFSIHLSFIYWEISV